MKWRPYYTCPGSHAQAGAVRLSVKKTREGWATWAGERAVGLFESEEEGRRWAEIDAAEIEAERRGVERAPERAAEA